MYLNSMPHVGQVVGANPLCPTSRRSCFALLAAVAVPAITTAARYHAVSSKHTFSGTWRLAEAHAALNVRRKQRYIPWRARLMEAAVPVVRALASV
jgi:hypothetical protein